jgi:transposase-like protein
MTEFKSETVKLAKQNDRTMADLAMELGIRRGIDRGVDSADA